MTHRIRSDGEALAVAAAFRDRLAEGASARDRDRVLPHAEVAALTASGLWAIGVPAAHGGADVAHGTVAEVTALLAEGDASVAQIPQNHFASVEAFRHIATTGQQAELFGRVIAGTRFGNAVVDRGPPTLLRDGRLAGRKVYSTGALYADLITVTAGDADGQPVLAIVARDAPGLAVIDDWSGMGQRTTASGTTVLDGVVPLWVIPLTEPAARRNPVGAFAQMLHAAIDLGIARAALRATGDFVRTRSRPFRDARVERAQDDILLVTRFGQLQLGVHAAGAMLTRGAAALDAARATPEEATLAAASIAVAEARVLTTQAALDAANGLFELAGTSAALEADNFSRFWRDARTHTLHDPVRWKPHVIGDYHLNGTLPPLRSYL